MGLCLGKTLRRALRSRLDCVTTGTERLEIVDAVTSFGEGDNVVHQDGSSQPSLLGAVPAQWLLSQHSLSDAFPPLVVAALMCRCAVIW